MEVEVRKPNNYWTYERCAEEALKCSCRSDFQKKCIGAYTMAYKNDYLDKICMHMIVKHKQNGYWTFEKCKEEALKYNTKKEFNENSPSAYVIARRNEWLKQISTHMLLYCNKYKRCVYSYEFNEDNSVYVGLTYNIIERQNGRDCRNTDQVTKHINETGYIPTRRQLTDYIDVEMASKLEGKYLEKYKNDHWNILNIKPTGGIGGCTLIWNKEKCVEAAKKCKTRSEFEKKYRGAYSSSLKNDWHDEVNLILKSNKGPKIKHTKELCNEKALLCRTRKEFKKNFIHEFSAAYKNSWLEDICTHMVRELKWTKEKCYEASLNCKGRFDFKKKYKGAYEASLRNNWLNEIFK
jgi:hypothetical protein